jgi:hypothetical protein
LENKKTVAATAETVVGSIIGSVGNIVTTETGVTGAIDTTPRIQMQTAIITTGTRDGAKAREM